jgi:hypothetical protein
MKWRIIFHDQAIFFFSDAAADMTQFADSSLARSDELQNP